MSKGMAMTDKIETGAKDTLVLFRANEYEALISLLHEFSKDPLKLTAISETHGLDLSHLQILRLTEMWSALEQKKSR